MNFLTNPPSTPWHQKKREKISCLFIFSQPFFLFFLSSFKAWAWPFFAGLYEYYMIRGGSGIIITIIIHDLHIQLADPSYFYMLQIKAKSISIWYVLSFFWFLFKGVSRRAVHWFSQRMYVLYISYVHTIRLSLSASAFFTFTLVQFWFAFERRTKTRDAIGT